MLEGQPPGIGDVLTRIFDHLVRSFAPNAPTPAAVPVPTRARRAGRSRSFAASLLATLVVAGTAAAVPSTGEVAAVLELEAPSRGEFVLRGTVPVPPNFFPRADGRMPLAIRSSNGVITPSQVELVARYPVDGQGASVVEVLSRVRRPQGVAPGTRIQYEVIHHLHDPDPLRAHPAITALLASPGSVVLSTRDAFGHPYDLDLLHGADDVRRLRQGKIALQTRNYGVLRPRAPKTGPRRTLKHLMGAHAYVTTWAGEKVLSLDLRVHNGSSGLDPNDIADDPLSSVYFDELSIVLPEGWVVVQAFDDPFIGPARQIGNRVVFPVVQAIGDGTYHVMPPQSQFHRRIAITREGNEAAAQAILEEEGLGFVRPGVSATGRTLWSWWNDSTSNYFAQRHTLPDLDYLGASQCRVKANDDYQPLRHQLETGGTYPNIMVHSPVLGWAHPYGLKYGGWTGGHEVFLYNGLRTVCGASIPGYRRHQIKHRMYTSRHPVALYDKTGEPTRLAEWTKVTAGVVHVDMLFYLRLLHNSNDPFGFDVADTIQRDFVASHGMKPAYENDLLDHDPIDLQHLVRVTNSAKVLVWVGNDALARDDLRMAAEVARLSYHPLPTNGFGGAIISGMLSDIRDVAQDPGTGMSFGRGAAWITDAMATYYTLGSPAWRAEARPWFDQLTTMLANGQQTCSGFIQSVISSKMLNGQFRCRQAYEQAIIENALYEVLRSVYSGADAARTALVTQILTDSLYSMVTAGGWDPIADGPYAILAIGPLNPNQPPYCGATPSGGDNGLIDGYQSPSSYAYGWELTGDPLFLQRAWERFDGPDLRTGARGGYFANIENKAALLELIESTNYP